MGWLKNSMAARRLEFFEGLKKDREDAEREIKSLKADIERLKKMKGIEIEGWWGYDDLRSKKEEVKWLKGKIERIEREVERDLYSEEFWRGRLEMEKFSRKSTIIASIIGLGITAGLVGGAGLLYNVENENQHQANVNFTLEQAGFSSLQDGSIVTNTGEEVILLGTTENSNGERLLIIENQNGEISLMTKLDATLEQDLVNEK